MVYVRGWELANIQGKIIRGSKKLLPELKLLLLSPEELFIVKIKNNGLRTFLAFMIE
ncbi:hypothetical protein ES705_46755 [subsurface metagenome]